ncbi:MAG: MOSC domain-containing protein, partial [Beggiatoa sp.]|nr:MOSC domain-containing protein [Beggiatoa sp.]
MTTVTIARLRERYPEQRFEVRRFRPNIVVELASGHRGFVENDWIGGMFAIGDEMLLSVTGPAPRCVMTTLPRVISPRTLAFSVRQPRRTVYASVGIESLS